MGVEGTIKKIYRLKDERVIILSVETPSKTMFATFKVGQRLELEGSEKDGVRIKNLLHVDELEVFKKGII